MARILRAGWVCNWYCIFLSCGNPSGLGETEWCVRVDQLKLHSVPYCLMPGVQASLARSPLPRLTYAIILVPINQFSPQAREYLAHTARVTAVNFSLSCEWVLSVSRDKLFAYHCSETGRRIGGYSFEAWCTSLQYPFCNL